MCTTQSYPSVLIILCKVDSKIHISVIFRSLMSTLWGNWELLLHHKILWHFQSNLEHLDAHESFNFATWISSVTIFFCRSVKWWYNIFDFRQWIPSVNSVGEFRRWIPLVSSVNEFLLRIPEGWGIQNWGGHLYNCTFNAHRFRSPHSHLVQSSFYVFEIKMWQSEWSFPLVKT